MKLFKSIIPIFASFSTVFATWFDAIPRTVIQPDGGEIHCFITGDQYGRRLHDENDFTIIQNEADGIYYYATKNNSGELVPSEYVAGDFNPYLLPIEPGLSISLEKYNQNKAFYNHHENNQLRDAPTSGEIAQINVFIRFADDPQFSQPRSYYDAVFQTDEDEPSLRHYYWEISYNNLLVNTFHYPGSVDDINTSYQDEYNRSYYQPYSGSNPDGYQNNEQRVQREHTLLANALSSIAGDVSPLMDIDANDDGYVDAVSFVIYGQPGDWADLLWPHRWSLYSQTVTINGAQVYDYLFMLSESWYFNVGVLCHEFFHVLGAPDYYHYNGGGAPSPVGGWDIMESTNDPPQYPTAYTKYKYGDWVEMIEIEEGGTYTLNPGQEQDSVLYKIASPNSESEYFVVEYRKQEGMYDINAPGNRSGLLAYRINLNAGNGNAQGPPDEIYCYRPGGTLSQEGSLNNAPYNSIYGHTQLNDDTNPASFLYNDGNGGEGGLNLYNVTEGGENISFNVSYGEPEITLTPSNLNFELEAGDIGSSVILLTNTGDPETVLNYEINIGGTIPFDNPLGGPDDGNYYWTSSTAEPNLNYEWIDIDGIGTELTFPHNDEFAEQIDLPFTFEFFGESYDHLMVNANGWVGWSSENETVWLNEDIPSMDAPRPAIYPFWDDLNPENDNGNASSSGNVYYHENLQRVVIWFNDVVRWNTENWGQFDFQIVLYADGRFQTNYRDMQGVLNSATIGWQNADGTSGTQIISNDTFVQNNLSWAVESNSGNIDWMVVTTADGETSGTLYGNVSENVYVQAISSGLEPGEYQGTIIVSSPETDAGIVNVTLNVSGEGTIPTLPFIDITTGENGIVDLPEDTDSIFTNVASRYTHLVAPNGDAIPFLIQENFTDEQIIHARNVLEFYLTNIPESEYGQNKTQVANAIASSNAILFLLNDEGEYENPDVLELLDAGVIGQDLLAVEVFPAGSPEYINSSHRDATYEEILHFIHVFGIQLAMPGLQDSIMEAMSTAIENEIYTPLSDLPEEDYDEEYLAMGLECFFGLWAHDPNGNGTCGDNEYIFINRDAMEVGDPSLYSILHGYFGDVVSTIISLPEELDDDFKILYDSTIDYTNKSQYLININLSGSNSIHIVGNNELNHFNGNSGNNHFTGLSGDDIINGNDGVDRAIYEGNINEYVILPAYVTEDTSVQVMDLIQHRDGLDHLFNIEEVQFGDDVYLLSDLLKIDNKHHLPEEFNLYPAFPNPFNPTTTIGFDIAESEFVQLSIFDIRGKFIHSLAKGNFEPGRYEISWDAMDQFNQLVSSGIYFIKFTSNSFQKTTKVLYLK